MTFDKSRFCMATALLVCLVGAGYTQGDTKTRTQKDEQRLTATMPAAHVDAAETDKILAGWMDENQRAARKLIEKYGQPNEATPYRLVWWNNGPWKYSMLENVQIPHDFPTMHHDMLKQAIDFRVPPNFIDDLNVFDGSIVVERTKGELSARCDKEEANFLAINLAHDIIERKHTINAARKFYAETIKQLMEDKLDDKHRPYVMGFIFPLPAGEQGDRDKPAAPLKGGGG